MEKDSSGNERVFDAGPERNKDLPGDPMTFAVIGAAQRVHRALGPGFKEATYHQALMVELNSIDIKFESQAQFEVVYKGVKCGHYQPDLVVEKRVIIELKAVSDLESDHFAQTVSYLRASGLPVGLLINFGEKSLTWRRFRN